jgi:hypothetical protein
MKAPILFTLVIFCSLHAAAQLKQVIQKDWIKVSIEDLSERKLPDSTGYTRYSFTKSALNISFYPGWNQFVQTWSVTGKILIIGLDTYRIEVLNDTAFVFALDGFRRMSFLSEEYLSSKPEHLDSISMYNGKPFYKANDYITPRYQGSGTFRQYVQKATDKFQIVKANYFLASFIVTETGAVESIIIHQGISKEYDEAATEQILKSSKQWLPAKFAGRPIQTEMTYEVRYFDSFAPKKIELLNKD